MFQATTKATADEMARAADTAKKLGADITLPATSAKDAALAMTELGKAGLTANQAMDASKGALQLAAAGQLNEAQAAEIAAYALQAFHLQASEANRVADLLAASANNSSSEVNDVAESLKQAGALAYKAKIPIEDLTAAISVMSNAGVKGLDAGTSLKTFIQRLQSPTKDAAGAMENLGIKIFDTAGKMKDLPTIIGLFEKSLSGLTDEKKAQAINTIFGADASRAASILFSEGEAGFDKMKTAITQTGAAADLAAAKTKGVAGSWEALKSQLETIGIDIFDRIKEPLANLLIDVAQFAQQLGDAFSGLSPAGQTAVVVIAAIAAAIGPVLIVVGSLVAAIGSIAAAFASVSAAVAAAGGIGAALSGIASAAAPVIAVLAAVGAAAYALYAAYQTNFGGFKDLVNDTFNGIVSVVQTGLQAVQQFWATYGPQIVQTATDTFNSIIEFLRPIMTELVTTAREAWASIAEDVGPIFEQISGIFQKAMPGIILIVQAGLSVIQKFWEINGESIKQIVASAWDIIKAVVSAAVKIVANVISFTLAIINQDWAQAWQSVKNIVSAAFDAIVRVIKGAFSIIWNALKATFINVANALMEWANPKSMEMGRYIIDGLINGITSGASSLYSAVSNIASGVIDRFRSQFQVQSPSKVTKEIGEYISEGLAKGIDNKKSVAVAAAKKTADEVIKQFKDAQKEFNKLAGASPEVVGAIQQTDRISDATGKQQDLIKLRGETGLNGARPLPSTVGGTEAELSRLQSAKQTVDDTFKVMQEVLDSSQELKNSLDLESPAFQERIKNLESAGQIELYNLQEQIRLTGITDQLEQQKIKNIFEIKRLREQMMNDGFSDDQIEAETKIVKLQQAQQRELQGILEVRKQVAAATDLQKNLDDQLTQLQNGGRELTEYEKVLKNINENFEKISPAQREQILNTAAQIDAQKQFNERYQQTYDFIRSSLDILTDSGTSFGEKMKSIFGGVFQSFKKMVLDMTAQWLTSSIFNGSGQTGQSGGGLGNIFKSIFGGSSGGSSGGGLFGGNQGNGIFNFAGGSNPPTGSIINLPGGGQAVNVNGSEGGIFSNITKLFSTGEGGLFAPHKNLLNGKDSKLAGIASGIGSLATLAGGLIGGKVGGVLSMAGMGTKIGAMFGPWGALAGAGIGAVIGLLGGDKKRKADHDQNLPALQKVFTDDLQALRDLAQNRNAILQDPSGTMTKAQELRNHIAAGGGIQFESKKYRAQAQAQITSKLAEADVLLKQIQDFSNKAVSAKDLEGHIVGEFAGGGMIHSNFMKQYENFKQSYGILKGGIPGKDSIPVLAMEGEMFLNRRQQAMIMQRAGEDVFAYADIPNYPKKPVRMADGGYLGNPVPSTFVNSSTPAAPAASSDDQPIMVNVYVSKNEYGEWEAQATSDRGKKVIAKVVEDKFRNDDLKLRRRGA